MMAHLPELDLSNLTIYNSTEDTCTGTTLTEFHLFTELPLELQQNIWDLYLPGRYLGCKFLRIQECLERNSS
jgi:hypothetical protein